MWALLIMVRWRIDARYGADTQARSRCEAGQQRGRCCAMRPPNEDSAVRREAQGGSADYRDSRKTAQR